MIDLYEIFEAILLEGIPIPELYEKFYKSKVPSLEDFITLNSLDPTASPDTKGKYLDFIVNKLYLKQYNKDITKMSDNKPTIKNALSIFTKVKSVDINSLSSLSDIEAANAKVTKSRTDVKKDIDKIYDKDGWTVIVPKTEAAAQLYGKNTKWCTSALDDCKFSEYNKSGPLFIMIHTIGKTTTKYQFQVSDAQFNDELNNRVPPNKVNTFPPEMISVIVKYDTNGDPVLISDAVSAVYEIGYDIGKLPLIYTCDIFSSLLYNSAGDVKPLKILVEILREKINNLDNEGNSALINIINMGAALDVSILKVIIKYMTTETISAISKDGNNTILHKLLEDSPNYSPGVVVKVCDILLYNGADKCINVINDKNETALSIVCKFYTNPETRYSEYAGIKQIITLLLKYKADVNINSITKTAYAKYIQMLKG